MMTLALVSSSIPYASLLFDEISPYYLYICCEHQSVVGAGKSRYMCFDQFNLQS
jgi:hypothetical protein